MPILKSTASDLKDYLTYLDNYHSNNYPMPSNIIYDDEPMSFKEFIIDMLNIDAEQETSIIFEKETFEDLNISGNYEDCYFLECKFTNNNLENASLNKCSFINNTFVNNSFAQLHISRNKFYLNNFSSDNSTLKQGYLWSSKTPLEEEHFNQENSLANFYPCTEEMEAIFVDDYVYINKTRDGGIAHSLENYKTSPLSYMGNCINALNNGIIAANDTLQDCLPFLKTTAYCGTAMTYLAAANTTIHYATTALPLALPIHSIVISTLPVPVILLSSATCLGYNLYHAHCKGNIASTAISKYADTLNRTVHGTIDFKSIEINIHDRFNTLTPEEQQQILEDSPCGHYMALTEPEWTDKETEQEYQDIKIVEEHINFGWVVLEELDLVDYSTSLIN